MYMPYLICSNAIASAVLSAVVAVVGVPKSGSRSKSATQIPFPVFCQIELGALPIPCHVHYYELLQTGGLPSVDPEPAERNPT